MISIHKQMEDINNAKESAKSVKQEKLTKKEEYGSKIREAATAGMSFDDDDGESTGPFHEEHPDATRQAFKATKNVHEHCPDTSNSRKHRRNVGSTPRNREAEAGART